MYYNNNDDDNNNNNNWPPRLNMKDRSKPNQGFMVGEGPVCRN